MLKLDGNECVCLANAQDELNNLTETDVLCLTSEQAQ